MTAAATLLSLLEFADGDQLLVLLEAENLLKVLEHHGRDREALKRELAGGASPGTLLLAVFREGHTADALIALLPPGTLERVKAQKAQKPQKASAAPSTPAVTSSRGLAPSAAEKARATQPHPRAQAAQLMTFAFIAYLVALVVPSMLVSGVLPLWTISLSSGVTVAAIGAGLAGLFAGRGWPLRIAGLVSGVVSAPGAVVLTYLWIVLRGGSILRIELALTVIIGALPGVLLFAIALGIHRRMSARAPGS